MRQMTQQTPQSAIAGRRRHGLKTVFIRQAGWLAVAALIALLGAPDNAHAVDVTLRWNANSESDLAGYTVYYGTSSGAYTQSINAGNVITTLVPGLSAGATYYFAVTAYDVSRNESGYSAEVSKLASDETPPIISGIGVTNLSSTGANVNWTTNEAATSQVEYGPTTAYGLTTSLDTVLSTSHTRALSGLQPSTLYHYRVWSVDSASNVAISGDNIFTTSAALDTTPPVLSGITASNITSTGAVITWVTNETATAQVDYGLTTAYGSSTAITTTLVTSQSRTLSGLAASTLYHYLVKSRDAAGNLSTSGDFTFTTSSTPDTTAPVISNVAASAVTATGATITWTTNEAATSQVDYGTTTGYGSSTTVNATLMTSHSRTLSGLTPSTLYHYRVRSADGANNSTVSTDRTFTTASAADTTPPGDVQNFTAEGKNRIVKLSWVNPPDPDFVGVRIRYRTDQFPAGSNDGTLLGDFTGQPSAFVRANHTGLQNGVTYYYSAASYDLSGNYQSTAHAAAMPTAVVDPDPNPGVVDASAGGGCGGGAMTGMLRSMSGGAQTGQALQNLLPSYVVIVFVGLLKWIKSWIKSLLHLISLLTARYRVHRFRESNTPMPIALRNRVRDLLGARGLRGRGHVVMGSQHRTGRGWLSHLLWDGARHVYVCS